MATLSFNYDGQSYVSDVFSGGKVVQLTFPIERTKVLYLETRLGVGLPWNVADSRILEKQMVVNVPAGGSGQEYRMNCIAEPASAEIVADQSGGGSGGGSSQPSANSVGSEEIKDGSIRMEDLDPSIVTTPAEARQMVADAIAANTQKE
jgi:hypothetical protein